MNNISNLILKKKVFKMTLKYFQIYRILNKIKYKIISKILSNLKINMLKNSLVSRVKCSQGFNQIKINKPKKILQIRKK